MAAGEDRHFRKGERAYTLTANDLPVYIGEKLGDLKYDDAVDLSIIKRTNKGLPATKEFIYAVAPPRRRPGREWNAHQIFRASKYNPYICVHCSYKTPRYTNMLTHLKNAHGDYYTDPRDRH